MTSKYHRSERSEQIAVRRVEEVTIIRRLRQEREEIIKRGEEEDIMMRKKREEDIMIPPWKRNARIGRKEF